MNKQKNILPAGFFKAYGAAERQDGLYAVGGGKYVYIYGYGEEKDADGAVRGYNWRMYFDHRPTAAELRAAVAAHVNAETEAAIRSGFTYDGAAVWLSTENQMNYKAAYDLAVQTDGASLPVTFKLGTDEEPVYRTFTTLDDLRDFYTAAHRHVQDCLAKGWRKKDAVKWEEYE